MRCAGRPSGRTTTRLSRLGIVLILRLVRDGRRRVVAAHYIRPTARDEHGHTQRLGPAVLATWDAATDQFEQFGWGVTPELAMRVGRRAGESRQVDRRRDYLEGLVAGGTVEPDAARAALRRYRPLDTADPTTTTTTETSPLSN